MNTNGRGEKYLILPFLPITASRLKSSPGTALNSSKLNRFMDILDGSPQETSDVNPNLVITITMKKMETQAGSSAWEQVAQNDTNNNDGSAKVVVVKKETGAKEFFCKNFFNKSSSGDKNNNQPPPVSNQYTKVTVDGLMSQLTLQQNRQMINQLTQHSNAIQLDASKR